MKTTIFAILVVLTLSLISILVNAQPNLGSWEEAITTSTTSVPQNTAANMKHTAYAILAVDLAILILCAIRKNFTVVLLTLALAAMCTCLWFAGYVGISNPVEQEKWLYLGMTIIGVALIGGAAGFWVAANGGVV